MDWHTFFKELKDSGRGAGLFMMLMSGGAACIAIVIVGSGFNSFLGIDWLILLIRSLQAVLALSLCALVGLPIYAWRGRKRHPSRHRSLGSYAPRRKHARQP